MRKFINNNINSNNNRNNIDKNKKHQHHNLNIYHANSYRLINGRAKQINNKQKQKKKHKLLTKNRWRQIRTIKRKNFDEKKYKNIKIKK